MSRFERLKIFFSKNLYAAGINHAYPIVIVAGNPWRVWRRRIVSISQFKIRILIKNEVEV
jgi:hypothetical protein